MSNTLSFKDLMASAPALTAAAVLALLLITAVFAPLLAPYDPTAMDLDGLRQPPGKAHLLGTDSKGRDILSRMVYGARISLAVGIAASFLSLCIGIFFGLIAGYFGGRVDTVLSQFFDVFLAFGSILSDKSVYGLADLGGNIQDWTSRIYSPLQGEEFPSADLKVARGGSWNDTAFGARASYRHVYPPGYYFSFLGFRIVVERLLNSLL